jgi:HK97 family phage major capsid protein
MLQQSTPDIEAIIRDDLAQVLARAVDSAALVGPSGSAVEPMGIINNPAVPPVVGAAPTYDLLVDITTSPANLNALMGSLGWCASYAVRGELLKLMDGMQRPYGLDVLGQGYPWAFTNLATAVAPNTKPLIFGNWNDLVIGFWSEIDLLVNPYGETAFSKGNVQLRGAMTLDIALRHGESFAWCPLT